MSTPSNTHAKGLLLTAIGGLTLTVDVPLIRLASGEPWSVLMLRSGATLVMTLFVWAVWRSFSRNAPPLIQGWAGLVVAALYGLGSIAFITAVYNTSTANLVFILSFTTMFSALLSWLFLKQRPANATLLAMAAMILGVLIIVWDSFGAGGLFGNAMALCSSFLIASAITISRHSGKDMGFAALICVVLPLAVASVMVANVGYRVDAPWWILFNGAVIIPISFYLLAAGPKYLSGPEVAMFYLLETVLAPIWVWMIFAEVPTTASLIGGTILIAALVAHSAWQLLEGRKRRVAGNFRHPV